MKYRLVLILGVAFCTVATCHAQKIDIGEAHVQMDKFVNDITLDFNNFRDQSMRQFAEFVKNPWKEFEGTKPLPKPNPKPVPPVIMEEEDKEKPVEDKPIIIDEVVTPIKEEPQPQPVEPIEEISITDPVFLNFSFFGTDEKVRCDKDKLPALMGIDESNVSLMLQQLSTDDNDNLILDCLEIRKKRKLCDWAYLQMLDSIAAEAYSGRHNESQLLLAYLYLQSGYKMRLASDGSNLYMLYASKHVIFDKTSFVVDGDSYYGINNLPARLHICQASFPKEKSLSLLITTDQKFAFDKTGQRSIVSDRYPDVRMEVSVNKNLLDFYSTYPTSVLDGNVMTRWAMYANTPIDSNVSSMLYPGIKETLRGKTDIDAVNMLLNALQTGLKYGYDDEVWGYDRAFFSEETLYYPFCDCEDRAILLTRIVRDILGLDCLLVYYPGHLAAAIEFTDNTVSGDYVILDGRRYFIADPTYINAPVGYTIPGMDNDAAKVIRVD